MFSGLLEKSVSSAGLGAVVGLIDAIGFVYSAKLFTKQKKANSRIKAILVEGIRLIFLIAVALILNAQFHLSMTWFLVCALVVSLGTKFLFIFKRMNA